MCSKCDTTKLSYYFMQWPFFQVNAGHPVPLRVPLFRLFLQISGLGFLFIIFIVSCRNAIHTVRTIVDKMIEDGNTVNMCAIDLSKAFDKVNHKETSHPNGVVRVARKLVVSVIYMYLLSWPSG